MDEAKETLRLKTTRAELSTPTARIGMPTPRRLNVKEIAKLAGVSKSTVSRVIQGEGRVADETRERVKTIMHELNFQPNIFARSLKGGRTGLIGVLSRWIESGFFAELVRALDDEVKPRGGRLLCSFTPYIDEYVEQWRAFSTTGQVDGVILVAPSLELFQHYVQVGDAPAVICVANPPEQCVTWNSADRVIINNRDGMRKLLEHLARNGCRRLMHIEGEKTNYDARERVAAFQECLAEMPQVSGVIGGEAWSFDLGYAFMRDFLKAGREMPDAFLAFNDTSALGIIKALTERSVRVPGDVSVTGWDNILFSDIAGLTTVTVPIADIARATVGMLYERITGAHTGESRHHYVDLSLRARRSSICCRAQP